MARIPVALSFDPSLAFRPDPSPRVADGAPPPSQTERREFEGALLRAARGHGAASAAAPTSVPAARTRLSGEQAAHALRGAWQAVRGEPPSDDALCVLVGQWAHETGRGASMLNYNFGGLKGAGPSGLSIASPTREGFGANAERVTARFRAYGSAEEGAQDYVSLLARRYPDALNAAERGDAAGFVRALKARGYFTDDEAAYARSVQSLAAQAKSEGFGALGAPGAASAPALAAGAAPLPLVAEALLGERGAREFGRELSPSALPVEPAAFADEVQRAALVMSALRIGEARRRS